MRITCPNCTAGFEIPTELLGRKGRSLKCATCGHSWFQAAVVDEIDLADVLADSQAAEASKDMGGPRGGPQAEPPQPEPPDLVPEPQEQAQSVTQAIAAAANAAMEQGIVAGAPTVSAQAATRAQESAMQQAAAPPHGASQGAPEKPPVPPGAQSIMSKRADGPQAGSTAQSVREDGGVVGGPQAAASLMDQAGAEAVGDDAISWTGEQAGEIPQQGVAAGPGGPPPGPNGGAEDQSMKDLAAEIQQSMQPGAQGGPGAAPHAGALPQDGGALDGGAGGVGGPGATGGPGAAAGAPQAAPGRSIADRLEPQPVQSLRGDDGSIDAPGEAAVSWLSRDRGSQGMPQAMPGMPGASSMPGMPGATGGPGAMPGGPGGPGGQPMTGQSIMQNGGIGGPGAAAVSQLSGQQIDAPGMGAQSLLDGRQHEPGGPGSSMQTGAQGGPGAPAVSQLSGEIQAPGDIARSILDGSEHAGGPGAQGGPGAAGASGGPGQSMLGEDGGGGPGQSMLEDGADGGPGASGGPGGSGDEGDLEEDLLAGEDDDAFFQAERGEDDDDDLDQTSDDDDAFFQAERGEDDDDLVDPDDDRPDFGGSNGGADDELDDDLDDDELDDEFEELDLDKAAAKQPKKPIDPAYVTAAVMSVVVLLIASMLFVARDQLAELWPGIEGVYEALNLDDDDAEGLRLSQPTPVRIMKGGVQTLVVTGFVTNLTEALQTVPNLKLMLIDKDNNVVQETTTPPSAPTIDPNSTQPYRIELQLPVETAASLRVDWD